MLGTIASVLSIANGAKSLFGGNDKDENQAYDKANPFLGWQKEQVLPVIEELLKRQGTAADASQEDNILANIPALLQQIQKIGKDPNVTRLRDVSRDGLEQLIGAPQTDQHFADNAYYNRQLRNLFSNPQGFNTSPAAQASMGAGMDALNASMAARGLLSSTNYADQLYKLGQQNWGQDYFKMIDALRSSGTDMFNQYSKEGEIANMGLSAGQNQIDSAFNLPNNQIASLGNLAKLLYSKNTNNLASLGGLAGLAGLNKGSPESGAKEWMNTQLMNEARSNTALGQITKALSSYGNTSSSGTNNTYNDGYNQNTSNDVSQYFQDQNPYLGQPADTTDGRNYAWD